MRTGEELLNFLQKSKTAFHAVDYVKKQLEKAGFCPLLEGKTWELPPGGSYYVTRNDSSLIAFVLPLKGEWKGFQVGASHSDSPTFRLKSRMEMESGAGCVRLNVEPYGGAIYSSWLDRPISVAGRAVVRGSDGIESRLVDLDRDMIIPNVAIHMNRKANEGYNWNAQTDMLPVFGGKDAAGTFVSCVAEAAGVETEDLLGMDLYLYARTPGVLWGKEEEYISAPRLDDLHCAYGLLKGFLEAENEDFVPVYALFDNEEVGSLTKQGADSTFLEDILGRIAGERLPQMIAGSFLLSADNAQAIHPAHPEYYDVDNRVYINEGVALKFNGRQKKISDGVSEAMVRLMAQKAGISLQEYANRSDMQGGSTLGNISNAHLSMNGADIGLPQWGMHSSYETAGMKDTRDLICLAKVFFSGGAEETAAGKYRVIFS